MRPGSAAGLPPATLAEHDQAAELGRRLPARPPARGPAGGGLSAPAEADGEPVADGARLRRPGDRRRASIEAYRYDQRTAAATSMTGRAARCANGCCSTPVDGARLSSGFGSRRHPILGYTRMHRGIDFAAPEGTPVLAAGAGRDRVAGRNRGYGNYVRMRHNSDYATAYAHLSVRAGLRRRPPGRAGRGDRLCRRHRPRDRAAPPLRAAGATAARSNPLSVELARPGATRRAPSCARFMAHRTEIDRAAPRRGRAGGRRAAEPRRPPATGSRPPPRSACPGSPGRLRRRRPGRSRRRPAGLPAASAPAGPAASAGSPASAAVRHRPGRSRHCASHSSARSLSSRLMRRSASSLRRRPSWMATMSFICARPRRLNRITSSSRFRNSGRNAARTTSITCSRASVGRRTVGQGGQIFRAQVGGQHDHACCGSRPCGPGRRSAARRRAPAAGR